MSVVTFPSGEKLEEMAAKVPDFMRPSNLPLAAYYEGYLSRGQCEEMSESLGQLEPYRHQDCGAVTRECHGDPSLEPLESVARGLNSIFWGFDLDENPVSWLQTYEVGGQYQRHMDGAPGQIRKYTAVALLTDPDEYQGGILRMCFHPVLFPVPRTQGTVVVFPSWLEHEVLSVTRGRRQTINMGFWGPPFK